MNKKYFTFIVILAVAFLFLANFTKAAEQCSILDIYTEKIGNPINGYYYNLFVKVKNLSGTVTYRKLGTEKASNVYLTVNKKNSDGTTLLKSAYVLNDAQIFNILAEKQTVTVNELKYIVCKSLADSVNNVQPSITVTSPNGGETYKFGDTLNVNWNFKNVNKVNINLINASNNYSLNIAENYSASLGSFDWTILSNLPLLTVGSKYKITVWDADAGFTNINDISDNYFSVLDSSVLRTKTLVIFLTKYPNSNYSDLTGVKKALENELYSHIRNMSFNRASLDVTYAGPYVGDIENCSGLLQGPHIERYAINRAFRSGVDVQKFANFVIVRNYDFVGDDCNDMPRGSYIENMTYDGGVLTGGETISSRPTPFSQDNFGIDTGTAIHEFLHSYAKGGGHSFVLDCYKDLSNKENTQVPFYYDGDETISANKYCVRIGPAVIDANGGIAPDPININSIAKLQYGWLKPSNMLTINNSSVSNINLKPIDLLSPTNDIQMVTVPIPNTTKAYVINYRSSNVHSGPGIYVYLMPDVNNLVYQDQYLLNIAGYFADELGNLFSAPLKSGIAVIDSKMNFSVEVVGITPTQATIRIINSVNACTPNWQAGTWSSCVNGLQTRTVVDTNNCGILTDKPPTSQTCISSCTVTDIYSQKIPGYVFYNVYIKTQNLPAENNYKIVGADSWNGTAFTVQTRNADGSVILKGNQTFNSVASSYIVARKKTISLTNLFGNAVCSSINSTNNAGIKYENNLADNSEQSILDAMQSQVASLADAIAKLIAQFKK
ncbi:MAG: hypothetical protein A2312_01765 [Candidatus Staskawiczbacteria bacterium RIFOXYB2_FULL_32_9]|uniref:Peptidase M11 gametolysin domain-containing protein n=1 Tax=Candidatus Staskawiczbacteria bacterium RIFOXYD1_FULL_32_13 TaxID=1802234 RepID=A0A1G2JKZ4_9BACT|nr:MAG: hypothetical protein UR22_C0010G0050 [Parcubacteria group bacterium GW2011_GWC2_32_10]OGZ79030.1 MAG: hypothetical protein A2360_03140 [Candidatus Staskawiczbacteria bacterium RIFOXYB1_FULL_32_11]OGZ79713.1 MAG: hypothetical protein A2256_01775 [Candidatus Staskawiczbacteria bacterium RIFOXYA2_FULL_32_7]OGZ82986.1 MAG: hypothetical protein A2312_01765 [Candidatus Staskawiczbacteria bacterium RIFOXYB2_FULL_32_9]OGZ87816.1 MAG: hypothetical protein A2561_04410 [Candidatus Staskawiczbacter